jgi:hypothetical protein|nr:MAG TPA: protein of unknown function (DUF4972) [Caudoviricetes sp.]
MRHIKKICSILLIALAFLFLVPMSACDKKEKDSQPPSKYEDPLYDPNWKPTWELPDWSPSKGRE